MNRKIRNEATKFPKIETRFGMLNLVLKMEIDVMIIENSSKNNRENP